MEALLENTIEQLKTELSNMGSTDNREFEETISKLITENPSTIIDDLYQILQDERNPPDLQFRAFFGITLHHRRQSNISEFKDVVERYIDKFTNIQLHYHVLSLMYKAFGDRNGILKSIEYSKKGIEKLNRHVGVLHNYCEAIVTALEENIECDPEDIENAISYIDTVITLSPNYAKFYCTKGRILAQVNKFDEAKKNVIYAIDIENNKSNDYSIRIGDYRNTLLQIKTKELYDSVTQEIEASKTSVISAHDSVQEIIASTNEKMESMKSQNLQMLAFFTAIISFIIGSINILSNQSDFIQSSMLILILAGAMTLVNVGFSILFVSMKDYIWKYVLVSFIGIFLIGTGLASYFLL